MSLNSPQNAFRVLFLQNNFFGCEFLQFFVTEGSIQAERRKHCEAKQTNSAQITGNEQILMSVSATSLIHIHSLPYIKMISSK